MSDLIFGCFLLGLAALALAHEHRMAKLVVEARLREELRRAGAELRCPACGHYCDGRGGPGCLRLPASYSQNVGNPSGPKPSWSGGRGDPSTPK